MKSADAFALIRDLVMPAESAAERIVPRSGFTAALTMISAAAMAFLAVFALTLSLSTARHSELWSAELSQTATIRIPAATPSAAAEAEKVLEILAQTPGIASAQLLGKDAQRALLQPWFGKDAPVEILRLPTLVDVRTTEGGPDVEGLRQRLKGEAPDAVYEDHNRWRAPVVAAASHLKALGYTSLALIAGVTAIMIALAASSALAANAQIIEVLRLVGAKDDFITKAFVRRFTSRTLIGAAIGTILGLIAIILLPSGEDSGVFRDIGLSGLQWLWPLVVPPVAAALSYGATRIAASRRLKEVT